MSRVAPPIREQTTRGRGRPSRGPTNGSSMPTGRPTPHRSQRAEPATVRSARRGRVDRRPRPAAGAPPRARPRSRRSTRPGRGPRSPGGVRLGPEQVAQDAVDTRPRARQGIAGDHRLASRARDHPGRGRRRLDVRARLLSPAVVEVLTAFEDLLVAELIGEPILCALPHPKAAPPAWTVTAGAHVPICESHLMEGLE